MSRNRWTYAEITLLRKKFATSTDVDLCKSFPRHTIGSIRATAYGLQLSREYRGQRKWNRVTEDYVPTFSFGHLQRLQSAIAAKQRTTS